MKEDWITKRLDEACEMYQPKTISKKEMVDDGEYLVFGANGVIGKYDQFNHEEPQLLITCRGASCGSVNISKPKSWINGNAMVIRPKNNMIDLNFLVYLFRGGIDLSKITTGAAQPQITRQSLNPIEISYPKFIYEQQRIVSLLDRAFTAMDQAKVNAEKNLQNAAALFESYLQDVFENQGKDWEEKRLEDVCQIVNGGTPKSKVNEYWNGHINWITPADLGKLKTVLVSDTTRKITDLGLQKSSAKLFPENSIILSTRAPIGHLAINTVPMSTNQGCRGIVPNGELDIWFLYYFLKGNIKLLNYLGSGTTFLELSTKKLGSVNIPLPPITKQKTIIGNLNSLQEEIQKLETLYQKKIDALDELKKSLLEKAFEGELHDDEATRLKIENELPL